MTNDLLTDASKVSAPSKQMFSQLSYDELFEKILDWKCELGADALSLSGNAIMDLRFGILGPLHLSLNSDKLTIQKGKTDVTLRVSDILQFYVTRDFLYNTGGKSTPSYYTAVYNLCAVMESGKHINIISLDSVNYVRILEVIFERFLEIKESEVLGEFLGQGDSRECKYSEEDLSRILPKLTKNLFCPKCKIVLKDSESELPKANLTCGFCGEEFDPKYKERKILEVPLDDSLSADIKREELVIKKKCRNNLILIGSSGWLILAGFFWIFAVGNKSDYYDRVVWMILPLVLLTCVIFSIMVYFNSTIIRVSNNSIKISVAPFFFLFRPKTIPASELRQLFVKRPISREFDLRGVLCAIKKDGSVIDLDYTSGLSYDRTVNVLQTLEVLIEKRLGIEDRAVTSEIC